MRFIKRLFSINTVILLGSLPFLGLFVNDFVAVNIDARKKLILHKGIVEGKADSVESHVEEQHVVIRIKLAGDDAYYTASRYVQYTKDHVDYGDSVELYTLPVSSVFGNRVSNELGSQIWSTKNPNEIFHLVLTKTNDVIIDFNDNQQHVKGMMWWWLVGFLLFFGWFLYRRSGRKSMFVIES